MLYEKFRLLLFECIDLLPVNLVNLTSNIATLETMAGARKDEYAKILTELEAVAKVQSKTNKMFTHG